MTDTGEPRRVLADRYALRGLLGQGGMADVELAYDEVLDRQVAVKMLHQRYAEDESFLARFRREAQAAASLNHPNVVAVYDTGDSGGRPFIVMEYVPGRSLREVLRQEGLTPRRAAEIGAEAALALGFAADRGLVHRDVKPANIMIADEGQVKVADFGIARAVNAENVTQTAAVFGTAAYVAPEQAQSLAVDGRTDIYALGCCLYEMLTGRQPFVGESAVALAYKHVSEAPVPPTQLNPDVPPALEAVVLKAMAKDPAARYQHARELADDLRRAAAGQPVSAPTGAAAYAATQALPATPTPVAYAETQAMRPAAAAAAAPAGTQVITREEYYDEPRGAGAGRIAAYAFLVILILALVGVAAFLFLDLMSGDEEQDPAAGLVAVPPVATLTREEAQTALTAAGFRPEVGEPRPDATVPEGIVIATSPAEGEMAPMGSIVVIVVSSGPQQVPVPTLTGATVEEAQGLLTEVGLVLGETRQEPDETMEAGRVVRTEPAAGIPVDPGTAIVLIVSAGSETFPMPNVLGFTDEAATQAIRNACTAAPDCAQVTVIPQFSDEVDEGFVISTQPAEGTEVRIASIVNITVSQGPEPTPEPPPTTPPPPPPTTPPPTEEPTTEPPPVVIPTVPPPPTTEPAPTETAAPRR